jgi:hypothetical protein
MGKTMDVAGTLGQSAAPVQLDGKGFFIRELDLNDLIDLEKRGFDVEQIQSSNMEQARLIAWLALRKSDPDLTDEERESGKYKITERRVGELLTMRFMRQNPTFIHDILLRSGFISDEPLPGNEPGRESVAPSPSVED